MNIYISHSSSIDFENQLYQPLEDNSLSENHNLVFPHRGEGLFDSKSFFQEDCDLVIAEVSKASTGLGIELGWADLYEVPIICVYRADSSPSSSLEAVSGNFIEYESAKELVSKLGSKIDD